MPEKAALLDEIEGLRENRFVLDLLIRQIQAPAGVIPFVGAGFSFPLGYSLWGSFLAEQGNLAGIAGQIETRLQKGEYEEAAEDLAAARGARRFDDAIRFAFGSRQLDGKQMTAPVSLLPRLAVGPVLTTNFDPVLETVFQRADVPFAERAVGARVGMAFQALHANHRVLIKLHGDYQDPADRVLTLSEYTAAYGSADPARMDVSMPLPRLLQLALHNRPLLFLGCSLNQDRTIRVLRHVTREYPELAHYALVELPGKEQDIAQRDRFLSEHSIRPIWFPPGKYESVGVLLDHILARARPAFVLRHTADDLLRELSSAGFHQAQTLSNPVPLAQTRHSSIYSATLSGRPVILKLTDKDSCSLPALRRIQGQRIQFDEKTVSITVATPEWTGESRDHIVEQQSWYPGVTLESMLLRSHSTVGGNLLAGIYNCLVQAVSRLHALGVLHRDISPSNVLISLREKQVELTLIDLSFAWEISAEPQIPVQNDHYTAPEQSAGHAIPSSDWFSIAATCYFLANRSAPSAKGLREGIERITAGNYCADGTFFSHPKQQGQLYLEAKYLFEAVLDPDFSKRPNQMWQLLLRIITHKLKRNNPLTGVLEVGDEGFILFRGDSFEIASRPRLAQQIDAEILLAQEQPQDFQRYLGTLKAELTGAARATSWGLVHGPGV